MDELLTWNEVVLRAGTPGRARSWLRERGWWRVVRDVYAPVELADGPEVRCSALRRVLPADAALIHRTALWALGVDVPGRALHVTVPRGRHLATRTGLRVHSADLPDSELCDVRGLLVVSAARAVVDVARSEPLVDAVGVGDAALRSGAATPADIASAVERARGLRRCTWARAVPPLLDGRSESLTESRLRVVQLVHGTWTIESQVDLYDQDGHAGRVDQLLGGVLGVEFDGRAPHLEARAFAHERRRQNRLLAAGLELRRFTADDLLRRPASSICAELSAALELARARPAPVLERGPDTLRPPRLRPLPTRADRLVA